MSSRAARVVASILVCSGVAIPAAAARAAEPVEVASAAKATLLAGDEDKQLCIGFDTFDTKCAEPDEGVATAATDPPYLGAAVPAAAARIEVRRAGVLLAGGPTVAGEAYKGVRAGSVRFALVRLPKAARTDGLRVRALDAAGSLISVIAAGDDDGELLLGRTRLLKGRSRGVTWSVTAEQRSTLTPSILDVAHETPSRCVVLTLNGVGRGRACESGLPNESLAGIDLARAAGADSCGAPPLRLLHGVVDGSAMAVDVVLGDGRRRTVRTVPVGDGRRTYAVATGAGAVRSVTIPGRGVLRAGLAPLSVICTDGGFLSLLVGTDSAALGPFALLLGRPPVTPAGPVTTIPGSPAMQVADGPADTLCLAFAGRPFDPLGCAIVSPLISRPLSIVDDLFDTHAAALAVAANVATVRLSSPDRKVARSFPTDPGTGYKGRYAGRVRFVALRGATDGLTRVELLDAAGRVLYAELGSSEDDDFVVPRVGQARRVVGRAGSPSLWRTNVREGTSTKRCLSLTGGSAPGPTQNCQSSGADAVLLDASCATHRLSVGIAVRAGTRVVADTGRATRRAVRLRHRMAVLTLPSGRPLRSLVFIRAGRKRTIEIGAPPAGRQCGWHFSPDIEEL